MTDARCQAKRIQKSDSGRQVSANERTLVFDVGRKTLSFQKSTPFSACNLSSKLWNFVFSSFSLNLIHLFSTKSHPFSSPIFVQPPRSTSDIKSFQINCSVCEAELSVLVLLGLVGKLSSVEGRRTGSGELYSASVNVRSRSKEGKSCVGTTGGPSPYAYPISYLVMYSRSFVFVIAMITLWVGVEGEELLEEALEEVLEEDNLVERWSSRFREGEGANWGCTILGFLFLILG
ncbi:hypothetical protein LR48_Vigan03g085600 [Vigna angularis]|uniref:Uncharacterized protein n=1 Tax=Phaseolus angularis TaxID=3914 RepID=A0A0L9U518_PHAAN|nr:hypothetical protein LR48_Vigan03g085600 [Vigna angularis]